MLGPIVFMVILGGLSGLLIAVVAYLKLADERVDFWVVGTIGVVFAAWVCASEYLAWGDEFWATAYWLAACNASISVLIFAFFFLDDDTRKRRKKKKSEKWKKKLQELVRKVRELSPTPAPRL